MGSICRDQSNDCYQTVKHFAIKLRKRNKDQNRYATNTDCNFDMQESNSNNLLSVKPSRQMHIRRSSTENSKANDGKSKTKITGVLKKSDSFNSSSSNNPSKKGIKFSETNEVYSYNKNSPVDDPLYQVGVKQSKNHSLIKHQSSSETIDVENALNLVTRENINLPRVMKLEAPSKQANLTSNAGPNSVKIINQVNQPMFFENSVIRESKEDAEDSFSSFVSKDYMLEEPEEEKKVHIPHNTNFVRQTFNVSPYKRSSNVVDSNNNFHRKDSEETKHLLNPQSNQEQSELNSLTSDEIDDEEFERKFKNKLMRHSLQRSTFKTSESNKSKVPLPKPMKKTNSQKFNINQVSEQIRDSPSKLKIHQSGIPMSATSFSKMNSLKSRNVANNGDPSSSQSDIFSKQFYFTEKFMRMKSPIMSNQQNDSTPSKKVIKDATEKSNDDSFFYRRSISELSNKNERGLAFKINSKLLIGNQRLPSVKR